MLRGKDGDLMHLRLWALLLAALLQYTCAAQKVVWVSMSGDDTSICGSRMDTACRTLDYAANRCMARSQLCVVTSGIAGAADVETREDS
jgi:hypothetical protein